MASCVCRFSSISVVTRMASLISNLTLKAHTHTHTVCSLEAVPARLCIVWPPPTANTVPYIFNTHRVFPEIIWSPPISKCGSPSVPRAPRIQASCSVSKLPLSAPTPSRRTNRSTPPSPVLLHPTRPVPLRLILLTVYVPLLTCPDVSRSFFFLFFNRRRTHRAANLNRIRTFISRCH